MLWYINYTSKLHWDCTSTSDGDFVPRRGHDRELALTKWRNFLSWRRRKDRGDKVEVEKTYINAAWVLLCYSVFICVPFFFFVLFFFIFLFSHLLGAAILNSVGKVMFCLAAPPINAKNAKQNKFHGLSNFISWKRFIVRGDCTIRTLRAFVFNDRRGSVFENFPYMESFYNGTLGLADGTLGHSRTLKRSSKNRSLREKDQWGFRRPMRLSNSIPDGLCLCQTLFTLSTNHTTDFFMIKRYENTFFLLLFLCTFSNWEF